MPSILLTETHLDSRQLFRDAGVPDGLIHGREPGCPRTLWPCTPYALGEALGATDHAILSDLAPLTIAETLTRVAAAYGGDTTRVLADVLDPLLPTASSASSYASAATGLARARLGSFSRAVQASQQAILDYYQATRPGSGSGRGAARQALIRANEELNRVFRNEMDIARRRMTPRYRSLSSDEQRLADLVRHTRKASRLDVASLVESGLLARLGQGAKYLGKGFMALDLGNRVHDIQVEYDSGGDWGRKAFVESAGFAAATVAGAAATSAGAQMLIVVSAATPAGWALIVGGLTIAAAIAATSIAADSLARAWTEDAYDSTAAWMRGRP